MKQSSDIIDAVLFDDNKWEYNDDLEKSIELFDPWFKHGRFERVQNKVGRNEKCPCGSLLKYKKCCGKQL